MTPKKILIVEDEAFIALEIKSILDQEGYETTADCFTMDLAIEQIELDPPHLILLDINLNDQKSGLDLAQILNNVYQIPFFFVTSYFDKETMDRVASYNPEGFITKPFKTQELISSVYLFFKKLNLEEKSNHDNSIPFAINQVLDYIHLHVKEKLDLEFLASMTPWETQYFGKTFKNYVGLTPYQYILKTKIEVAKGLLETSDLSIQAICFDLGFSSYGNFYNSFKKFLNMTPENYRFLMSKKEN
jgi:YesN/AraC family two-component response regulator